jgi:hypothetical protein
MVSRYLTTSPWAVPAMLTDWSQDEVDYVTFVGAAEYSLAFHLACVCF